VAHLEAALAALARGPLSDAVGARLRSAQAALAASWPGVI
jgi:hypothetical protein